MKTRTKVPGFGPELLTSLSRSVPCFDQVDRQVTATRSNFNPALTIFFLIDLGGAIFVGNRRIWYQVPLKIPGFYPFWISSIEFFVLFHQLKKHR